MKLIKRCRPQFVLVVCVFSFCTSMSAEDDPAGKPRYKMPSLMMVTWAEWPEKPEHQDQMAQFIKSHGFNAVEVDLDKLEMCRRNGLYARLGNVGPEQAAKLKDDKTVFAYFISDRRRASAFPTFAQIAKAYEKVAPNHPTMFINRANWNEFGRFTEEVKPLLLDFYHYHWDRRRYPERRYIYLASFRELGQKNGIPVMRCTGANVSPGQLRQTIYSSLAYGIQGFHFWPPWLFSLNRDKDNKPILKDGKIVPRVNLPALAEVAKEIKPLGKELVKLRSTAVYHTPPVHPQAPGAAAVPKDFWVQPSGEQLLVGVFADEKQGDYLFVVNCDAGQEREAKLKFLSNVSAVERLDKKTGKWKAIAREVDGDANGVKLNLSPGNGKLLKVARQK